MKPTARELATIRRLRDSLGATSLIELPHDHVELSKVERAKQRAWWRDVYPGRFHIGQALGPSQVVFVIDWSWGPESDRWQTRPAKMLRQSITRAGFDRFNCAFVSLDGRTPPDDGRPPEAHPEMLLSVLGACDTRFVVLVGAHPMSCWHPEITLGSCAGKIGVWNNWWVMPIYHPNAVLRELIHGRTWQEHLARFRQQIDEGVGLRLLDHRCCEPQCTEGVSVYDTRGMPWCDKHLDAVRKLAKSRDVAHQHTDLTLI